MEGMMALERYRRYLEALDEEVEQTSDSEDVVDLLTQGEVVDLLCARDELAQLPLNVEQKSQLARLDNLLVTYRAVITGNLPPLAGKPRNAWWWRLHEGPQVRDEAEAA